MAISFTPFPNLQTERLFIRQMELSDAGLISDMRIDARVTKFITGENYPENTGAFITMMNEATAMYHQGIMWMISLKDKTPVGTISLMDISAEKGTAEVGCAMYPDYWSKGYMQEAAMAVMRYAFDVMKLKSIGAYTHRDNPGATRLLLKFGFKPDEAVKLEGEPDQCYYSIENEK